MERATAISKTNASSISLLVLYTTITQNATSPLARSRYSPSVKSPGVKYVSGVLFFTRCMLPPEGSGGGATKETREEDKAEDVQRGEGVTRVLVFLRLFAKHRYCCCRFSTLLVYVRVTIIIAVELDDREMPLLSHYSFHGRYHRGMLRWSRCFSTGFSSEFLLLRWPHVHSNILEFSSVSSAS